MDPTLAEQRREMLDRQLAARGVDAPNVLQAMNAIPRERFVPPEEAAFAYEDRALPIECGQTISQPYIVGLMTQSLRLTGSEKVLEIGCGSGYQAAVLSRLAHRVVSVERHFELAAAAADRLRRLGLDNVSVVCADGSLGWPLEAPYDRILVAAGGPSLPEPLFEQLSEGGRLVMPIGDSHDQTLLAVVKVDGKPRFEDLGAVRFVPLIGAFGWPDA